MATLTVRALDSNGDPLQGNGQNNYISDITAAAQIIKTAILLFQGEWFEDKLIGTPMFQKMLGASGGSSSISTIINLLSARITGLFFVTGIQSFTASYLNRNFIFNAKVNTIFGTVFVSNTPADSSAIANQTSSF